MEEYLIYIQTAGIVGVWIIVFWLAKLILTLKSGIDAQKSVIESITKQADYVNNLQGTVTKLYDPKEIENLVSAKTENELSKHRGKFEYAIKRSDESIKTLYYFVGSSINYLDKNNLQGIFNSMNHQYRNAELENFAFELRVQIEEIRAEEMAKALGGKGT